LDSAEQEFGKLLQILEGNRDIVVIEHAEEWEDDDKLPTFTPGEIFKIPGSVASFIERLDDELTRALQHIDPHTAEYVERLTDETSLYTTLVRALVYEESLKNNDKLELSQDVLNRVVMRRLEHLYFKVSTISSLHSEHEADTHSPHKSSLSSKTMRGERYPPNSIQTSPPAPSPTTLPPSSRHLAHTSSSTAKALSELALCSARSTSWRCMITTTSLAT
jgi:hypothetical protein